MLCNYRNDGLKTSLYGNSSSRRDEMASLGQNDVKLSL